MKLLESPRSLRPPDDEGVPVDSRLPGVGGDGGHVGHGMDEVAAAPTEPSRLP